MTTRFVVAGLLFVLVSTQAAAQGLIAFPWKACPVVDDQARCVWVVRGAEHFPVRPHEGTEGNFHLDLLNPGLDDANVVVQLRNSIGVFQTEIPFLVAPGHLRSFPSLSFAGADVLNGVYLVIRSDRPLLLWALYFQQYFEPRPAPSVGGPNTAVTSHSLQVIPVDCSDLDAAKTFGFICNASEGPGQPS